MKIIKITLFIFCLLYVQLIPVAMAANSFKPCIDVSKAMNNIIAPVQCNNFDDILCKDVPKSVRRGCSDRDQTIIHSNMSMREIYDFSKGCLKSAITSFTHFFTEFIPELVKGLWSLSKNTVNFLFSGNIIKSTKGAAESISSIAFDIYENVKKNPGVFFNNLWDKIVDTLGPIIANYDCHSPQAKVEKICGIVSEFIIPPAILAKAIIKGPKWAQSFLKAKKEIHAKRTNRPTEQTTNSHSETKQPPPIGELRNSFEIKTLKKDFPSDIRLPSGSNDEYIRFKNADAAAKSKAIYFEVENSVLKELNDHVFQDKGSVDAINNLFMSKLYKNIQSDPILSSRIKGKYKDYKSLRLRVPLAQGEDDEKFRRMFNALYQKTNKEFVKELQERNITKKLPPSTGDVGDVSSWFKSGSGKSSIEANLAARNIRNTENAQRTATFRAEAQKIKTRITEINNLGKLFNYQRLIDAKIIERLPNGNTVLSKDVIEIIRKERLVGHKDKTILYQAIQNKIRQIYQSPINENMAKNMVQYYEKIDSLSPPIYASSRVSINLAQAKHGIVSVDFAGLGAENIYQQMKTISITNPNQRIEKTIAEIEKSVDTVTVKMNQAKKEFNDIIRSIDTAPTSTRFSGDDGIYMPKSGDLTRTQKKQIVQKLAGTSDPSQFRLTFVEDRYLNGKSIPPIERSRQIVKAEGIEKKMRSIMVGHNKIPQALSKKIVTAIESRPTEKGGSFNLIYSGKGLTAAQKTIIENAFKAAVGNGRNDLIGSIIFI